MTRNEFIAQFILSTSVEPCEGSSMTEAIEVGKELADALEEAKCAPWMVPPKSCTHAWGTYAHDSVLAKHCQKCGMIEGAQNPNA